MRRILAIRTADREFGEQLAKNFNKDADSFFQTFVFSEQEAFSSFVKSNVINVLLCDEEIIKDNTLEAQLNDVKAELVLSLSELNVAEEVSGGILEGIHSVFKYQASEQIMKEVLYYYDQLKGLPLPEINTETLAKKVCCICSPVGGAYSSTFALALALSYSQNGKTLFISFDPFFTLPGRDKDPKDKDLTDVIFFSESSYKRHGFKEKLADYISNCAVNYQNLSMLNGVSHWFDICDMNVHIMHDIIESTCNTGLFQNVVFDTGIFGAASMEILMVSDNIYVPIDDSVASKKKVDEWRRQIKYSGREAILEKAKELRIPIDSGLKGEYGYEDLISGTIGKYITYYNL